MITKKQVLELLREEISYSNLHKIEFLSGDDFDITAERIVKLCNLPVVSTFVYLEKH